MPRCPRCRTTFRTLEDEEGMHDCPRCGETPHDVYVADRWLETLEAITDEPIIGPDDVPGHGENLGDKR